MTTMLLIRKPAPLNGVDLALCKRLAQEACRRASAAESWATLIFGRLNRQQCAPSRESLPSWRTRLSCVRLSPRSCTSLFLITGAFCRSVMSLPGLRFSASS